MASFNQVTLLGNVCRDPEVRYTPGGTAVCDVSLAVNRTWFDKQTQEKKESVAFIECTLWARTAEVAGEYLGKGSSVLISGRLEQDTWQDKETGNNRSKLKVVGETMTMVGGKPAARGEESQDGGSYPPVDDDVPF